MFFAKMQCFLQRNIKIFHVSRETYKPQHPMFHVKHIAKEKEKVSRETLSLKKYVSRETFIMAFLKLLRTPLGIAREGPF